MRLRRELFIRRKTVWKTTWLLRLSVLGVALLFVSLTWRFWLVSIGESLVQTDVIEPSDLIVVEDFDGNYWLYRVAARLVEEGFSSRVVVLTAGSGVNDRIIAVHAEQARLHDYEVVRSSETEPIALNTVQDLKAALEGQALDSVIVVAMGFRSRRTSVIYSTVFGTSGVRIATRPVLGPRRPDNWWHSWHGTQNILLEFAKLQYYRLLLL